MARWCVYLKIMYCLCTVDYERNIDVTCEMAFENFNLTKFKVVVIHLCQDDFLKQFSCQEFSFNDELPVSKVSQVILWRRMSLTMSNWLGLVPKTVDTVESLNMIVFSFKTFYCVLLPMLSRNVHLTAGCAVMISDRTILSYIWTLPRYESNNSPGARHSTTGTWVIAHFQSKTIIYSRWYSK